MRNVQVYLPALCEKKRDVFKAKGIVAPHKLGGTMERTMESGSCRYISGDPSDIHTKGGSIFCGKPVARESGAWCSEHERVVYVAIKELGEARKAA